MLRNYAVSVWGNELSGCPEHQPVHLSYDRQDNFLNLPFKVHGLFPVKGINEFSGRPF
tara:strand:+ start:207 stop:380 length:174 start_codon:yes stop_codon:yes gene_type:complete